MYGQNNLKIKVNKDELLSTLRVNREKHAVNYAKAKEGFRILLEKELKQKLRALQEGKSIRLDFKNRKPTNNLKDYDDVISMLELSTDAEIQLDHQQYKQYFKDTWDWTKMWESDNTMYLSAALQN